jgi:hypothetical protein
LHVTIDSVTRWEDPDIAKPRIEITAEREGTVVIKIVEPSPRNVIDGKEVGGVGYKSSSFVEVGTATLIQALCAIGAHDAHENCRYKEGCDHWPAMQAVRESAKGE